MLNIPENLTKYVNIRNRKSYPFDIVTYTIKTHKGLSDDDIYAKHPELVQLIPRAFSQVYHDGKLIAELRGINKFTGTSVIDEDDTEVIDNADILRTVTQWEKDNVLAVEYQEKANGKFACFQLFHFDSITYLFGGSKNVHVIFDVNSDIVGDELHHDILRSFKKYLTNIENIPMNRTFTAEYVDGKHLIYTEMPYLVFFGEVCDKIPYAGQVLPKSNKLPTYEELNAIRNMENTEGCVIIYKNTATSQIIRQKHKTIWYVLWRSIREVTKSANKMSAAGLIKRLKQRIHERSDMYLHLSPESLAQWELTSEEFVSWFNKTQYKYADVSPFSQIGIAKILYEFKNNILHVPKVDVPEVSKPVLATYIANARKFGLDIEVKGDPEIINPYKQNTPLYRPVNIVLNRADAKKEAVPQYYGLFPKTDDVNKILRDMILSSNNTTPFHVTVHFVGGSPKLNIAPLPELLGTITTLNITGYSTNIAGACLTTSHPQLSGNHITISVNDGFKPMHVGTEITLQNSFRFVHPIQINAMYLPMY